MDFVGDTGQEPNPGTQLSQALTVPQDVLLGKLNSIRGKRPPVFAFTVDGHRFEIPVSPWLAHEVVLLHCIRDVDCTVLELAELLREKYQMHNPKTTTPIEFYIAEVNAAINNLNNTP